MAEAAESSDVPLPHGSSSYKIPFQSSNQLEEAVLEHRDQKVDVQIRDVIDMVSEIRGATRRTTLRSAIIDWFLAAGLFVFEADVVEPPPSNDSPAVLVAFRVRIDGSYDREVARAGSSGKLAAKYQEQLLLALPGDALASEVSKSTSSNVQVSWVKPGIELGGIVTLGAVVAIVVARAFGQYNCSRCCSYFPCITRGKRDESPLQGKFDYKSSFRALVERGAEFKVNPDGSAALRIPPLQETRRCLECPLL